MSTDINIKKKLAILDEGASVTTDASSIDFVGSGVNASTVGGDVTITIPGGSGNTTYYLNQTVNQAPYKEFSSIVTSAVEQVVPLTVLAGATSVIAEYQTPSNIPGTTQIPGGLWQFFLHFNAVAAGQNWIIRPTVYKRDLGGIETLIFTPDPEIVTGMPTVTTMFVCDGVFPASTILTTDRIVVRISMQNTTGVSQTVNFRTEGSQHYSVGLTTLNQVIPTGAVTSVTGTAPIVSSGGLTPAISIPQSSATVDGYLSSSNWSVFDAKQGAITLTTTGSSGASTFITNTLNVPTYTLSGLGGVPSSRSITINGTTLDLSADRTWNVGTVTGSGTINRLSKWTSSTALGNSLFEDDGTSIAIGTTPSASIKLDVYSTLVQSIRGINGSTSVGNKTAIEGTANGVNGTNIGGYFYAQNGTNNYSVWLNDGTAGIGKFLKSITPDGKANWANITVADTGLTLTTTGTSGVATLVGSTLNVPNYATSSSGICGIANSSGVYTYYATLSLAMAAAVSGQTVDILTDITETGSVTITTKTGVKINGNGYTYTLSVDDATNAITVDSYLVELFNWKVVRTGRANGSTGYVLRGLIGPVNLKCYNVVFENTYGYGVQFYGSIYGLTINTYSLCAYQQYDDLNLYNCNLTSTNLYGISTVRGEIFNSTVTALTDAIVIQSTSLVSNSVGRSTGSGVGISAPRVVNSTGISSSGTAISSTNGYNCVGISTSGVGLSGTFTNSTGISTSGFASSGGTKTNCTLISSSNYGSNLENLNNCFLQSTTNVPLWLSTGKLVNSCTALCLWDNVGGHAINTTSASTGVDIRNCNLTVTNASAYCLNGASGSTFKYASNTYKGSTTAVNSTNITQGITNTSDNQGNILI